MFNTSLPHNIEVEQRANDTELEITKLENVRGALVDIADLTGEARRSFSSTIDWLSSFINE